MTSAEVQCLDHGFVRLVDHMGSDARIVDAARVSYQRGTKAVQSDRHLIRYLLRNLHTTPFEKVVFEFHIKLPIFVARQWMRHRTGSFNEVSARYSVMPKEFYTPNPVRKQSAVNRQGSSEETLDLVSVGPTTTTAEEYFQEVYQVGYQHYQRLLGEGCARELARAVLPVALYTEFYWTVNLWNLMHFLKLRVDKHAQWEVRVFGEAILKIIEDNCDLKFAMEAFKDYIVEDPDLSKFELQIIKNVMKEAIANNNTWLETKDLVQKALEEHPDMSKREKNESRLIDFLWDS